MKNQDRGMNSTKISSNVIDEMFPEGSGNMLMELDEVISLKFISTH